MQWSQTHKRESKQMYGLINEKKKKTKDQKTKQISLNQENSTCKYIF